MSTQWLIMLNENYVSTSQSLRFILFALFFSNVCHFAVESIKFTTYSNNSLILALGSCPCVGVGGASIGGGHSRLQGEYGLIIDVISKLRVALWNGTIVDVTADENEDLFWAMRGAGHNFGIVLEYTFDTFPQQHDGMNYNGDMTFTIDSLEGVLCGINELIPDQDPGLAMDFFVIYNQTTGIVRYLLARKFA